MLWLCVGDSTVTASFASHVAWLALTITFEKKNWKLETEKLQVMLPVPTRTAFCKLEPECVLNVPFRGPPTDRSQCWHAERHCSVSFDIKCSRVGWLSKWNILHYVSINIGEIFVTYCSQWCVCRLVLPVGTAESTDRIQCLQTEQGCWPPVKTNMRRFGGRTVKLWQFLRFQGT